MVYYSRAWGKLIHEKNQKQKISWHCPFKRLLVYNNGTKSEDDLPSYFCWCIEPLICRAFGKASLLRASTTHGWSREPLMCSTLMFGTLKLGLIDLQSAPRYDTAHSFIVFRFSTYNMPDITFFCHLPPRALSPFPSFLKGEVSGDENFFRAFKLESVLILFRAPFCDDF